MAEVRTARHRIALACICAAAALLTAASPAAATPAQHAAPRPLVLLLPGGGFFFDIDSMPYPARMARRLGFSVRFVPYPTPGVPNAVRYVRRIAARSLRRGRRVYVYGESAGGTMAALLAQRGLVGAASTYCPIADLLAFVRDNPAPDVFQAFLQASDHELRTYSPLHHDSAVSIRVMLAVDDQLFMNRGIRRWDRADPDVFHVEVPGGHLGDLDRPDLYRHNVRGGLRWLARKAGLRHP